MWRMDATANQERATVAAAKDAATSFGDLRRQALALAQARARDLADAAQGRARDMAGKAQDRARDIAGKAQDRARDLAGSARERTRAQIDLQRSQVAETLEDLAAALRPKSRGRAGLNGATRPRISSGLILVGALSLGVVGGIALTRRMRARRAKQAQADAMDAAKSVKAKVVPGQSGPSSGRPTRLGDGEARELAAGPTTATPYT